MDLWKNETRNINNWISIRLEGKECNRLAIGARIELRTSSGLLKVDQITGGNGYASQESAIIHFGIGQSTIEEIKIFWPQGHTQIINHISENKFYKIKKGEDPEILFNYSISNFTENRNDIKVYPNPASNEIYISHQGELNSIHTVNLYNYQGEYLFPIVDLGQNFNGRFNLVLPQGIRTGLYFLKIESGEGVFTKKVYIIE